jgi:biopolymer transport protein TolQ
MGGYTFSILSLFTEADLITKLVSILLVIASIWSWAIVIEKLFVIKKIKNLTDKFENKFWSGGSLDDLFEAVKNKAVDPMSKIFVSAMREWRRSSPILNKKVTKSQISNINQRMDKVMEIALDREMEKLENRMNFLASTGSVAPLVGLFGTVWGIMNSFSAIGESQSTSLGVIAPGISVALATTALGLIAAIPAVIFYNKITSKLLNYQSRLENFSGEFSAIISRQIDESLQ